MKFEHHVRVHGSEQALWSVLGDFPRVARLMPGVEEVVQKYDGAYEGRMRIKVGPIGFNLSGVVTLDQNTHAGEWRMRAEAQDRRVGGGVRAIIDATVANPAPDAADLTVTADIQFMGRLGQLGQPIIKHKADQIIKEFANNLQAAISQGV